MRTIKKLMSLLLVLTMIAAFFGVTTASADTEDVSLTVAKSGETVTMTLTANKALDFGGLSFNYGFDDAAFSYTEGSFTSPIGTTATENTGNKYLAIDSANQINVAAGEAIISMTFQVAAGYDETKDYNFSMAMSEAYPFDWQADPYSWENETLTETLKGSGATQEPETVDLSEIMINKTVAGTGFDPITFTFNVVPDGTAPVMFQNNKVTLDVTTAGEFTVALANPEAGFTAEGTYQYTISEEDGGVKDWEYDDHVFVLNVVVREVSEGVYAPLAAFVLPEGSTNEEDKCDIEFTNSYEMTVTTLTVKNINDPTDGPVSDFRYSIVFHAPAATTGGTKGATGVTGPEGPIAFETAYPFTLGHNGTAEFSVIPDGTTFELTETGENYYTHSGVFNDGTATEVTGPDNLVMSGTLNKIEGGNNVTVTNKYVAPETTTLTIDKVVEGEAPFDKEFEFTITFTALEGFENMKVQKADGTEVNYGEAIPFNLTNGTNIQFKEIPVGVTYVLTEAGVVHYTPSYSTSSGKSGSATSGADLTTESIEILTGENTITVTNTYSDTVPTGVTIHGEMIAIVLLVLVAMAGSFILTRKMRRA